MSHRRLLPLALGAGALLLGSVPSTVVWAAPQDAAPEVSVRVSDSPEAEAPEVFTEEELDQLYRDLYGIQMELGRRSGRPADLDSLRAVRDSLLTEIRGLARQIERRGRELDRPGPADEEWQREFDTFVRELESTAADADWDGLAETLGEHAETWGEGLALLGNELKELRVDIDEDRVRIDTGSGSRVTFTIPREVKEELRRGIAEVGVELERVLGDSNRGQWGRELETLLDELPDDVSGRFFPGRQREKTVIAESIFRVGEDVEVGEHEIVQGDVLLMGGDAYVAGEVDGNVFILFGDLFVEERGSIAADAVSVGGRVRVDDDSEVRGRRFDVSTSVPGIGPAVWGGGGGIAWLVHWSRVAVLALLIVAGFHLVEKRMTKLAQHGQEHSVRDLASGALWYAVALGLFVLASGGLVISVIGIPVVLVLVAGFGIGSLLAYAVGCHVVGERLLTMHSGAGQGHRAWQAALLGMVVLEIPALVSLAFASTDPGTGAAVAFRALDFLLKYAALSVGIGAMVATRGGAEDGEPTPEPDVSLALPARGD